jgi:hypothetical protein
VHVDSSLSAPLVAWGNAWLAGHVGLDEAVDRIERITGPAVVRPAAAQASELPLRRFLAECRGAGLHTLRLALPVPGDPLGLTGPPDYNGAAIEAGQAVTAVLADHCVGLVPAADRRGSSYTGVRWTAMDAETRPPDLPSLAEAEHMLTLAMRLAADALQAVDGPRQARRGDRPQAVDGALAPGYPARAHRVAALAARLAAALGDAGELGLTAAQRTAGTEALRELDRAVRRAQIAAHHAMAEPGQARA